MAYGIYKAYKDGPSDSKYVYVVKTEDDAKKAVELMESLRLAGKGEDQNFASCEGWEFRCHWTYEEVSKPITFVEFEKSIIDQLNEIREEFGNAFVGVEDENGE